MGREVRTQIDFRSNSPDPFLLMQRKIENILPGVRKDIPMKDYTTFKIGGPARFFYKANNKEKLINALKTARSLGLPVFILGGGSNLLVSDKGFNGLVIKTLNAEYKIKDTLVWAEAGMDLKKLLTICLDNSLAGLEWAAGIPGTVGGAIRGNVAAFGSSISDNVLNVEAYDLKQDKIKRFSKKECLFREKETIFKKSSNLVVLSSKLKTEPGQRKDIKTNIEKHIAYRSKNHPIDYPSAGCIFKNTKSLIKDPDLLKKHPLLEKFNQKGTIPTGYLIECCGLKGKRIGEAQISSKHANFIINLNRATAKDVLSLINLAKSKVKEKFNVTIEEEISYLGF